jgi:plastocyanin
MFASSISVGLALLPFVVGKVWNVDVGGPNAQLVFNPTAVPAKVGDQVTFHFNPKNHSVVQSSFDSPCGRKAGGFDSGFFPVAANTSADARPIYTIVVNDTNPIWVYCAQAANTPASHCGQGMIFSVNCPQDGSPNSLANFTKEALAVGASLSAAAASAAETAATSGAAGYGGYGAPPPPAAASPTLTAAYGGVTIPPAVSETVVTAAITMDSNSIWTTVYTSFANSPAATPAAPAGAVHTVVVGGLVNGTPQLVFTPDHLVGVSPRDTVVFQFQQKNHSVVQSSFADPCRPLNINNATAPLGFNSGFMPVPVNSTDFPTWSITVNDTTPIWAYCGQTAPVSHCGAGMVFAINAVDNSTRSYDAFVDVAKQLNGTAAASGGSPSNTASGATASGNTGGALSLRGSSGVVLALVAVVASLL